MRLPYVDFRVCRVHIPLGPTSPYQHEVRVEFVVKELYQPGDFESSCFGLHVPHFEASLFPGSCEGILETLDMPPLHINLVIAFYIMTSFQVLGILPLATTFEPNLRSGATTVWAMALYSS